MDAAESENPAAPDRSKRIYVLWGVGFALLAALAAFCWLVVGPVMEVGRVIESYHIPSSCLMGGEGRLLIDELGGPERASRKLTLYLRVSALTGRDFGGNRESAAVLMGHCGKWGLARAIPMLKSGNSQVLQDGVLAMCAFFGQQTWWDIPASGPGREKALGGLDPETRVLAEEALSALIVARDATERGGR
jgi:hypothetical protein